jgi:hypothetical protein
VDPQAAIAWVQYTPDGRRLLSASAGKVVHVWDTDRECSHGEISLLAQFAALGCFGSPDGIGGQGAVGLLGKSSVLVIGDQGGRLYQLSLEEG